MVSYFLVILWFFWGGGSFLYIFGGNIYISYTLSVTIMTAVVILGNTQIENLFLNLVKL